MQTPQRNLRSCQYVRAAGRKSWETCSRISSITSSRTETASGSAVGSNPKASSASVHRSSHSDQAVRAFSSAFRLCSSSAAANRYALSNSCRRSAILSCRADTSAAASRTIVSDWSAPADRPESSSASAPRMPSRASDSCCRNWATWRSALERRSSALKASFRLVSHCSISSGDSGSNDAFDHRSRHSASSARRSSASVAPSSRRLFSSSSCSAIRRRIWVSRAAASALSKRRSASLSATRTESS